MKKEYHSIIIPQPHIYESGGLNLFDSLPRIEDDKTNLLVIPFEYIEQLQKSAEESVGAEDALKFFTELEYEKDKIFEGARISEKYEGLDVLIVDIERESDKDVIEQVHGMLSEKFDSSKIEFLSNRPVDKLRHAVTGITLNEPRFLQVDEIIVRQGIIGGTPDLEARLRAGPMEMEEAAELLRIESLRPNQFIRFPHSGEAADTFARVFDEVNMLEQHEYKKNPMLTIREHAMKGVLGVKPRDMEQYIALQYGLLDPNITLFFLCGSQGSGKTLLSFAAALDQVLVYTSKEVSDARGQLEKENSGLYEKVRIIKPNEIMGGSRRDTGFLPGKLYDKLKPHMMPYIDAFDEMDFKMVENRGFAFEELLKHQHYRNDFGDRSSKLNTPRKLDNGTIMFPSQEPVVVEFSGFARGRSFRNSILLVDEAQNFTPYELKTIIERTGEGCKIVIMGDPMQVDNPECSRKVNGLTAAINHYLGQPYCGLVNLSRNYRSEMSEDSQSWRSYAS